MGKWLIEFPFPLFPFPHREGHLRRKESPRSDGTVTEEKQARNNELAQEEEGSQEVMDEIAQRFSLAAQL